MNIDLFFLSNIVVWYIWKTEFVQSLLAWKHHVHFEISSKDFVLQDKDYYNSKEKWMTRVAKSVSNCCSSLWSTVKLTTSIKSVFEEHLSQFNNYFQKDYMKFTWIQHPFMTVSIWFYVCRKRNKRKRKLVNMSFRSKMKILW